VKGNIVCWHVYIESLLLRHMTIALVQNCMAQLQKVIVSYKIFLPMRFCAPVAHQ